MWACDLPWIITDNCQIIRPWMTCFQVNTISCHLLLPVFLGYLADKLCSRIGWLGSPNRCCLILRTTFWISNFGYTHIFIDLIIFLVFQVPYTVTLQVQWNLVITRTLGPWKLPSSCYIRFLLISGWKNKEIQRAGTSKIT